MSHNKKAQITRCPLCSRHCPLTSPHCHKGEKYARSLQKKSASGAETLTEIAPMGVDDTLLTQLHLFSQNLRGEYRDGGSRYRILSILLERENISQQELTRILGIKSGSLSELLAKLEKKGLIRRKKNDSDKRNRDIVLTDDGRAWFHEHSEPKRAYAKQLFSGLSEEEKMQLSALLGKLLQPDSQNLPAGPVEEDQQADAPVSAAEEDCGSDAERDSQPIPQDADESSEND